MGSLSRQKGKRGEREAAAELNRVLGCTARRGQQFSGGSQSPDVVTNMPGVHFEVKRVEKLNLQCAMDQAVRDAVRDVPVVLHRRNGAKWFVSVYLDDLPQLVDRINEFRQKGGE